MVGGLRISVPWTASHKESETATFEGCFSRALFRAQFTSHRVAARRLVVAERSCIAAVRSKAGQFPLHGGLVNEQQCLLLPRADVRGEHALLGARSAIARAGRRPPPVPVL